MGKLFITASILLFANHVQAQQYDTYGRSQATREWQETERHYNSMKPGSKPSSSAISGDYNAYGWGDNSRMQKQDEAAKRQDALWKAWFDKKDKLEMLIQSRKLKREPAYFSQLQVAAKDAGFSDYDVSRFFGYSAQEYGERLLQDAREKSGTGEADRLKTEFDRNMEKARKERQLEQQKKDEAIRVEIANFAGNWNTATSTDYGIELRRNAFKAMYDYMIPIMERQKKMNRVEYTDQRVRESIRDGENSISNIQYRENSFFIQTKQFALAYKNGNVNIRKAAEESIPNLMGDFVYAGLLTEKNPTNVILEKAAYAFKKNDNKINHFAYALFLDNDIDGATETLEKHIAKHPGDTVNRIGYLNKLLLLKLYRGKDEEALKLYNSNSSVAITDIRELTGLISFNIITTLKACTGADEKTPYYIYPVSALMDMDLLALLQPNNEQVQSIRKKMGDILHCPRYLSPIGELWTSAEKKNTNSTTRMEELLANGSMSTELRGAVYNIGFPWYVPEANTYAEELNDIDKFHKKNSNPNLPNIEIIKGYVKILKPRPYLTLGSNDFYNIFYKPEDLESPVFTEDDVEYLDRKKYYRVRIPLKTLRYGYSPDEDESWYLTTDERPICFYYTSKSKAEKAVKLYTALIAKLQKQ